MSSAAAELARDRARLKVRLRNEILALEDTPGWSTLDELLTIEARIQATAQQLKPGAPQNAIAAVWQELAYNDLGNNLVWRAKRPRDSSLMPEPRRIRIQQRGGIAAARK